MSQHPLSTPATRAVEAAQHYAQFNHHAQVDSLHLLHGLLITEVIPPRTLEKIHIAAGDRCLARLETAIQAGATDRSEFAEPTLAYMRAMQAAESWAGKSSSDTIEPEHILLAVLEVDPRARDILVLESGSQDSSSLNSLAHGIAPTPTLDRLGRDLTDLAKNKRLNPVIGREKEVEQIFEILLRRGKNSVLLTGPAGVGKTAVVERLALDISAGHAPLKLQATRLIELSTATLLAGTSYRGEMEARAQAIINEAQAAQNVILVIDEFHTVVGAGKTRDGGASFADILKPALARGDLTCIGITTSDEYVQYVEQDAALARRFQPVEIRQLTGPETLAVLVGIKHDYEQHHGLDIDAEALESIIQLAERFITNRQFPDKAIDVLGKAFSRAELRGLRQVDRAVVAEIVGDMTGIPVGAMDDQTRHGLALLETDLAARVVGQREAIALVARAIRLAYTDLRNPEKPVGVFLFVGPSGVGKTELVKAMAEKLFGSDKAIIRLDMSEYAEKISMTRLLGAPPGYVGHEQTGQLVQGLREHPHSIVLLDEVEKAHPEIFDVFLQLFDEGRLTDAHGRTVDGRNAIFVMTSNLHLDQKNRRPLGFAPAGAVPEAPTDDDEAVHAFFRPEMINRFTEIVHFNELDLDDYVEIAQLELRKLADRMLAKGLKLTYEATTPEFIAQEVLKRQDSARGISHLLQEFVTEPISDSIVQGQTQDKRWVHLRQHEDRILLEWL